MLETAAWGGIGLSCLLCGCHTLPSTRRRQLLLVSAEQEQELASEAWESFLDRRQTSQHVPLSQLVWRVGQRLARASDQQQWEWDFQLLVGRHHSAFCLPGGKLAITEGTLTLCETEAGLATLMAHEIGHATLRHGAERLGQQWPLDALEKATGDLTGKPAGQRSKRIVQSYGGTAMATPFGPHQEQEADYTGLHMMARAGYDPHEATRFWSGLLQAPSGNHSLLGTLHPGDSLRLNRIMSMTDEAWQTYTMSKEKHGLGVRIRPAGEGTTPQGENGTDMETPGTGSDRQTG